MRTVKFGVVPVAMEIMGANEKSDYALDGQVENSNHQGSNKYILYVPFIRICGV